jgi:hypothetical protein
MPAHPGEVHVLPHEKSGGWTLEADAPTPAAPWFGTVGEAEQAAQRQAAARGDRCYFLHDRYYRVRSVAARARPR